jgi:hypothetical protein
VVDVGDVVATGGLLALVVLHREQLVLALVLLELGTLCRGDQFFDKSQTNVQF